MSDDQAPKEINREESLPLEKPQHLLGMCFLGLATGVIGGLGAWLFRAMIGVLHNLFFLGKFQIAYDSNVLTPENPWGWGIIIVPVLGALIVAWLVKSFAPEAKGHGVPEVIDAVHYGGGRIRPIVAVVKSLASAVCIGSGGSVGREGPIVQIGSAFGSTIGQLLKIPVRQRNTLIAAGAAAGIAATFNAPLGGVVFAIELLMVSINARTLLPVIVATVAASYIGEALIGPDPSFDFAPLQIDDFHLQSPWPLLLSIPLGLLIGLAAIVFVKGVYWCEDLFDAMPGNAYSRHCLGMLGVGLILYAMFRWHGSYYVEGVGYSTIMAVLTSKLIDPVFLLMVCGLKIATTCLTLGSGGSGGIFSPSLVIGATLGACFGNALKLLFPQLPIDVLTFALAGMAAMVGATTGAVITAAVMLQEMTDDNNIVLPVIATTIIAWGIRKRVSPGSMYTTKLLRRGHVVPEGLQAALDDARSVSHLMSTQYQIVILEPDASFEIPSTPTEVTIYARDGVIVRVFNPSSMTDREADQSLVKYVLIQPTEPLVGALRKMQAATASIAVVASTPNSNAVENIVGVLTHRELSLYRTQFAELFE